MPPLCSQIYSSARQAGDAYASIKDARMSVSHPLVKVYERRAVVCGASNMYECP